MVADKLGRYHWWYKWADLQKPGIRETQWKELPSDPQDDSQLSYTMALAMLGSPKQPSYGHPKLLGRIHMYHQRQNIGHLTQKSRDKATDYNETVYDRELNKLISYLQGIEDLNHSPRHKLVPTSLLNPEIVLPEAAFRAACRKMMGWIDESWTGTLCS